MQLKETITSEKPWRISCIAQIQGVIAGESIKRKSQTEWNTVRDNFSIVNRGGKGSHCRTDKRKQVTNRTCEDAGKRVRIRQGAVLSSLDIRRGWHNWALKIASGVCESFENTGNDEWLEPAANQKTSQSMMYQNASVMFFWLIIVEIWCF